MADQWLGKQWDRFDTNLDYAKYSGPDDFTSEGTGYLQGQTFPHPFKLGKTKDDKKNKQNYYDAVTYSPMGNELLLAFAKTAIINEKLGQADYRRSVVRQLFVQRSDRPLLGPRFAGGARRDAALRRPLKDLLDFLDAKVGKENYYFALSADHGVCPLPEFAQEGRQGGGPRRSGAADERGPKIS